MSAASAGSTAADIAVILRHCRRGRFRAPISHFLEKQRKLGEWTEKRVTKKHCVLLPQYSLLSASASEPRLVPNFWFRSYHFVKQVMDRGEP